MTSNGYWLLAPFIDSLKQWKYLSFLSDWGMRTDSVKKTWAYVSKETSVKVELTDIREMNKEVKDLYKNEVI